MFNYILNQINKIIVNQFDQKIQKNESIQIKLKSPVGETNWFNISQDDLQKIIKIFENN